jgi:glutamate dehydrogenase/leucine dehydrogenase
MAFESRADVWIAGARAHRVYSSHLDNATLITVVHKNDFPHKLGGTRVVTRGTVEEAFHLARGMSEKCLVCQVPLDGLKTLIIVPDEVPRKEIVASLLARHMRNCIQDDPGLIFGPDMGTPENVMVETLGLLGGSFENITGLSREMGGLDIDRNGFTALGVSTAIKHIVPESKGVRVSIQGYGEVGSSLAAILYEMGFAIRTISDISGVLIQREGIDTTLLHTLYSERRDDCLIKYARQTDAQFVSDPQKLFEQRTDLFIPAARTSVLSLKSEMAITRHENPAVRDIESMLRQTGVRYIVEVANHPLTFAAEDFAERHGVVVLPDFIINCGGMIGCYTEWKFRKELLSGVRKYEDAVHECKLRIRERVNSNLASVLRNRGSGLRSRADVLVRRSRAMLLSRPVTREHV